MHRFVVVALGFAGVGALMACSSCETRDLSASTDAGDPAAHRGVTSSRSIANGRASSAIDAGAIASVSASAITTASAEPGASAIHDVSDPSVPPASSAGFNVGIEGGPAGDPPEEYSARCPAGTLEIQGTYCTALMHRCLKGRTYEGKKVDGPSAYFCDEYDPGKVNCLGKEQFHHLCMDLYEYPNRRGAIPRVMVSWYEAKRLCEERGERLCGDDEWTMVCEGPERRPYAYGWRRDPAACNIDRPWRKPDDGILASKDHDRIDAEVARLSQREPSGARPGCTSSYGIMDMGGNVDEWTVNVTLDAKPYRSMFKGGHWCKGARNRCRPNTESHDETTAYYAEGFRCCADPR